MIKHTLSVLLCLLAINLSVASEQQVTISHAIAMHGAPKYAEDFKGFDYTSDKAIKGGKFRLGEQGNFDSLNPFISKGNPEKNIGLIYDTLMRKSLDEAFSIYGLIAETIELPEDRSWVIFNLRKEARFHDGHPITAEDVVYTFNLLVEKGAPLYRSYFADVESVEALNDHRVKFTFKNADNPELALIVGDIAVLPKHYWEAHDFSKSSLEVPLGSAAYKVATVDAGRSITYERVNDYWAADLPVNRGVYNYDQIHIDYYKDSTVLLEALKSDQFDFIYELSSKQWATGYDSPAVKKGLLKKEAMEHSVAMGMQAYIFNLRNPKFQDIRVRKAFNYAFDFEWTNKNLFYGLYKRNDSFFTNSELASSGLPSPEELEILTPFKDQLPASVFNEPYTNTVTDGSGHNRKNLIAAAKLLKEAGWIVKDNQLVNGKTGEPFEITIYTFQPSLKRILLPYSKNLKKLGITMNVRDIEVSQYINKMRKFDYEITSMVISQTHSPGNEQREYWTSKAADIEGSRNYYGIKNPVVDALVELIITAPDREQLVYRTRALDRVLMHNYYVVPHYHPDTHKLAYWDKFGRPDITPKYDFRFEQGIYTWWIDPAKEKALKEAKQSLN